MDVIGIEDVRALACEDVRALPCEDVRAVALISSIKIK